MRNPFKKITTGRNMLHEKGIYGFEAFLILADMLYCKKKFHATYEEYLFYGFQNLKNRVRKNYLLKYHQRVMYSLVDNDPEHKLCGKEKQYLNFGDMIKREWMHVKPDNISELRDFIKKHKKVIFKPVHGTQGKGIFSFSANEIESKLVDVFGDIVNKDYFCEQYVIQHPKMNELNPNSVNTIRTITLCDGETVRFVSAGVRMGKDESVCDNMSAGGVGAAIDTENGVVYTTGIDFKKNRYYRHPITGTQIIGFEIPFWSELREMVEAGALRTDKTAVIGWDIAITAEGPCLIEANNRPAGRLAQIAADAPMGEYVIDYINNNWRKYFKKIPKPIKKRMKKYR